MGHAHCTSVHAVIPGLILCPQVMALLNQDLAAINPWCLQCNMRLIPSKPKSMAFSRSRTVVSGYDDLTFGDAEFEDVKRLRILGVTSDSKLTVETPLREVVSKAAMSRGGV